VDKVMVNCPSATTLTRLELTMPGWSAHVNGQSAPISSNDGLTQTVSIPAGVSTITFTFLPPYEEIAMLMCALALVAMASTWRPRRWRNTARGTPSISPEVVLELSEHLYGDSEESTEGPPPVIDGHES
jgi:hypothetical protein